jgi:hypothetical protein
LCICTWKSVGRGLNLWKPAQGVALGSTSKGHVEVCCHGMDTPGGWVQNKEVGARLGSQSQLPDCCPQKRTSQQETKVLDTKQKGNKGESK